MDAPHRAPAVAAQTYAGRMRPPSGSGPGPPGYWSCPSSYLNICKRESGQPSDLSGREPHQLRPPACMQDRALLDAVPAPRVRPLTLVPPACMQDRARAADVKASGGRGSGGPGGTRAYAASARAVTRQAWPCPSGSAPAARGGRRPPAPLQTRSAPRSRSRRVTGARGASRSPRREPP